MTAGSIRLVHLKKQLDNIANNHSKNKGEKDMKLTKKIIQSLPHIQWIQTKIIRNQHGWVPAGSVEQTVRQLTR